MVRIFSETPWKQSDNVSIPRGAGGILRAQFPQCTEWLQFIDVRQLISHQPSSSKWLDSKDLLGLDGFEVLDTLPEFRVCEPRRSQACRFLWYFGCKISLTLFHATLVCDYHRNHQLKLWFWSAPHIINIINLPKHFSISGTCDTCNLQRAQKDQSEKHSQLQTMSHRFNFKSQEWCSFHQRNSELIRTNQN